MLFPNQLCMFIQLLPTHIQCYHSTAKPMPQEAKRWIIYSSSSFSFIRDGGQFPITWLLYFMDSCHDMPEYILIHQSGRLVVYRPIYTWEVVQGLGNYREASTHLFFKGNSNLLVFWSQSLSWFQLSLETHVPRTPELWLIPRVKCL